MPDYLKLVTEKEEELNPLYKRMDEDKDLYCLNPFIMRDYNNQVSPNVNNVTRNDPQNFANSVMSTLLAAVIGRQTVVEGKGLSDKQTSRIEGFVGAVLAAADERARRLYERVSNLESFWVQQVCLRGRVAARCYLRADLAGGCYIADILPVDTRYLSYERALDTSAGLCPYEWVGYRMKRAKSLVEKEYGYVGANKQTEVVAFWDKEMERIYIDGELRRETENPFGYPPFIIEVVPVGSMLFDDGAVVSYGESIFGANREIYRYKNQAHTIFHTITHYGFKPATQYKSPEGTAAERPELPPYMAGAVVPVPLEGGYYLMPFRDVSGAALQDFQMLESMEQRGGLSDIDFGDITFPLSAVAIKELAAKKNQLFIPRLQALSLFYEGLSKMGIDQFKHWGEPADFDGETYSPSEVEKIFTLEYTFSATSPAENIANYSIAGAAERYVSKDTIRRDILKLENPDQERDKMRIEQAEMLIPELRLLNMGRAALAEGKDIEAQLIADKLEITIEQLEAGQFKPPEKKEAAPEPLVPLIGEGGGIKGQPQREAGQMKIQQGTEGLGGENA